VALRLRTTLASLLLCTVLLPSVITRAAEEPPAPPAALPAYYLPLVTAGGNTPDLAITGLEVTQSTQTSGNSLSLVAGRPTVVRVYAVSDQEVPVSNVTVSLSASRNGVSLPGSPIRVLPKSVGRISTRDSYTSSFNALLPQAWLSGGVTIMATLDPDNAVAEVSEANNTARATLTFHAVPELDVKIIPIRYTHTPSGRTYAAPTRDTVSDWVMRSYPISSVRVTFHAPVDFSGNLSSTREWERLLDLVTNLKSSSAPYNQVYYALVPTESGNDRWFNGGVAGIGWVGLRAAVSLDFGVGQEDKTGRIAAHELGHNLGRYHAPCGTTGDPRQPFPHANASLGADVYGLDIASGRVWSPRAPDSAKDVMSYCTPQWISDYTYNALYEKLRASSAYETLAASGHQLLVRARIEPDGTAELLPVYSVNGTDTTPVSVGEYAVELLDDRGALIARHPVDAVAVEEPYILDIEGATNEAYAEHEHGTSQSYRIHAVIPAPGAQVAAVRLVHSGAVLGEQRLDSAAARVEKSSAPPSVTSEEDGAVVLRWSPVDAPALVRYTQDGRQWTTLGVDVLGGELRVDPASLPRGGTGRFEVTPAGSDTPLVVFGEKANATADAPPQVWISGPAQVRAGEPALLYGHAADLEDGALSGLSWTLNGVPVEGDEVLQLPTATAGSHSVTLTTRDSSGNTVTATASLRALP
jgi:hypothetical protein